jgi:hypothetical protein
MNLLAGAERYPYRHFLLYDVTGEMLGAVIPLSLGYALGACWEAGSDLLGALSGFAFILFLVILFVSRQLRRKLPHSKEILVAYRAVSTQKLTVKIPLPQGTLQRMTGVRRQNIGEQRQEVTSSRRRG